MVATVESLQISYESNVAPGANADTVALTGFAGAAEGAIDAAVTMDQKITTATRSLQSYANAGLIPAAQANAKIEAAERLAAAQILAANDARAKGTITAEQYADAQVQIEAKLQLTTQAALNAAAKQQALRDAIISGTSAAAAFNATLTQTATTTAEAFATMASSGQSISNIFASVKLPNFASDSATYAARAADIDAYGQSMDRLRAKYDPLFAASKAYESELDGIAEAENVGAISATTAAAARDRVTAGFQAQVGPAQSVTQAVKGNAQALDEHATSSGAASAQLRNLTIQATQFFSGVATGQPILMSLVQQGHQIADSALASGAGVGVLSSAVGKLAGFLVSPIALAAAAGAGLVYLGVSSENASRQIVSLQQTLRSTQSDYANLATQVIATSHAVAASSALSFSDALDAGKILAASKSFGPFRDQLDDLERSAGDISRSLGVDVPTAAGLLKAALEDPTAAAKKLADDGFGYVNQMTVLTVQHLQAIGDSAGASKIVLNAYKDTLRGAADAGTPLAQALHGLSEAFTKAGSDGRSVSQQIGDAVTTAGTIAVKAITGIVQALHDAHDAVANLQNTQPVTVSVVGKFSSTPDANAGVPTLGEPVHRANGTYEQAVGLMQVMPSTANGYGFSASQIANNTNSNILVGLTDLLTKIQQAHGNLYNGLAAYGGASSPDKAASYVSSVTSQSLNNLPQDVAQTLQTVHDLALQVGANAGLHDLGLDKFATLGQQVALQESSGHQYATPAQLARQSAYVNGTTIDPTRGAGEFAQFGPSASASQIAAGQAQLTNLNTATGAASSGTILTDRNALADQIKQTSDALNVAIPDTQQYDLLSAKLNKLKGDYSQLLDPVQQYFKNLQQSTNATTQMDAVSQALVTSDTALNEASLRRNGTMASGSEIAANHNLVLQGLSAEYRKLSQDTDRQTALQDNINNAYGSGVDAVQHATDYQQAYNQTLGKFVEGSPAFQAQVDALTTKLDGLARSKAIGALDQQIQGLQDSAAYIQAETDTIGMNWTARDVLLAKMKAEQDMHAKFGSILPREANDYIELTGQIASATDAYQKQQASLSELSSFATNTFQTISDAITQAFATGSIKAIDFGNIAKSVLSSLIAEVAKLSILNPILDNLFDEKAPTITSVGGIVGKLLGNNSSSAATTAGAAASANDWSDYAVGVGATGAATAAAANVDWGNLGAGSTEDLGVPGPTGSGLLSFGTTAGNGSGAGLDLSSSASSGLFGSGISGSTLLAGVGVLGALGALTTGKAPTISQDASLAAAAYKGAAFIAPETTAAVTTPVTTAAAGAVDSTSQALGITAAGTTTASTAVANALPYIGTALSIVSDLVQGNYRGAALVATGAAAGAIVGTYVFPVIGTAVGTAVGAAVGGLVDTFFPQHPKNAYESVTDVVSNGQLTSDNTVSQLDDPSQLVAGVNDWNANFNSFLKQLNLTITNASGEIAYIGQGVSGVNQLSSPDQVLNRLRFGSTDTNSNFGIAAGGDLAGQAFASVGDFTGELQKIADFADRMTGIGIQLAAVAPGLTNINVASVSGSDDLHTALEHDLPGQTFADEGALDAEIGKVNQFVAGTIPTLLAGLVRPTSDFQDSLASLVGTYQSAIDQAQAYGLATDALTAAQSAAAAQTISTEVNKSGGLADTLNSLSARDFAATGNQEGADLENQAISAKDERQALDDQEFDIFGAAYAQTADYATHSALLEQTLADERLAIQQKYNDAATSAATQAAQAQAQAVASAAQSVTGNVVSLQAYITSLQTGSMSPLSAQDQLKAAQDQFSQQATLAQGGDASALAGLQGYADTALKADQAVNGSGAAYGSYFDSVLAALQSATAVSPDTLTASAMAAQTQSQTTTLVASLAAVQAEIAALRAEVKQGSAAPLRVAA